MFTCTRGKGFSMRFDNGLTLSVQWGTGNYCDNWNMDPLVAARQRYLASQTAEVRVVDDDGNDDYTLRVLGGNGDNVFSYVTTDRVAEMMAMVAGYKGLVV